MQHWEKKGLLFAFPHSGTHSPYASVPVGFWLNSDVMRIIFSTRNENNQSVPCYLDYNFKENKPASAAEKINLLPGPPGTFDDSGVMPTCLLEKGEELWMYYIGWNLGVTVPFRNSIGLAISTDKGKTFVKKFEGPVLDRTKDEPHFTASCCVIEEDGKYKIWYLSCTGWEMHQGRMMHRYHIKYATSANGFDWNRDGRVAIDFRYPNEYAISVPRVVKEDGIYKMWYSYRGGPKGETYRIGYAESVDGVNWTRKDEEIDLDISAEGWDSEMLCYPFVFSYNNRKHMLYNGNDYGKTGFGLAVLGQTS